jgi:hypothetical protein
MCQCRPCKSDTVDRIKLPSRDAPPPTLAYMSRALRGPARNIPISIGQLPRTVTAYSVDMCLAICAGIPTASAHRQVCEYTVDPFPRPKTMGLEIWEWHGSLRPSTAAWMEHVSRACEGGTISLISPHISPFIGVKWSHSANLGGNQSHMVS